MMYLFTLAMTMLASASGMYINVVQFGATDVACVGKVGTCTTFSMPIGTCLAMPDITREQMGYLDVSETVRAISAHLSTVGSQTRMTYITYSKIDCTGKPLTNPTPMPEGINECGHWWGNSATSYSLTKTALFTAHDSKYSTRYPVTGGAATACSTAKEKLAVKSASSASAASNDLVSDFVLGSIHDTGLDKLPGNGMLSAVLPMMMQPPAGKVQDKEQSAGQAAALVRVGSDTTAACIGKLFQAGDQFRGSGTTSLKALSDEARRCQDSYIVAATTENDNFGSAVVGASLSYDDMACSFEGREFGSSATAGGYTKSWYKRGVSTAPTKVESSGEVGVSATSPAFVKASSEASAFFKSRVALNDQLWTAGALMGASASSESEILNSKAGTSAYSSFSASTKVLSAAHNATAFATSDLGSAGAEVKASSQLFLPPSFLFRAQSSAKSGSQAGTGAFNADASAGSHASFASSATAYTAIAGAEFAVSSGGFVGTGDAEVVARADTVNGFCSHAKAGVTAKFSLSGFMEMICRSGNIVIDGWIESGLAPKGLITGPCDFGGDEGGATWTAKASSASHFTIRGSTWEAIASATAEVTMNFGDFMKLPCMYSDWLGPMVDKNYKGCGLYLPSVPIVISVGVHSGVLSSNTAFKSRYGITEIETPWPATYANWACNTQGKKYCGALCIQNPILVPDINVPLSKYIPLGCLAAPQCASEKDGSGTVHSYSYWDVWTFSWKTANVPASAYACPIMKTAVVAKTEMQYEFESTADFTTHKYSNLMRYRMSWEPQGDLKRDMQFWGLDTRKKEVCGQASIHQNMDIKVRLDTGIAEKQTLFGVIPYDVPCAFRQVCLEIKFGFLPTICAEDCSKHGGQHDHCPKGELTARECSRAEPSPTQFGTEWPEPGDWAPSPQECVADRPTCTKGEYVDVASNDCTACPAGHFRAEVEHSESSCEPTTKACQPGQHVASKASATQNIVCASTTQCVKGAQYETRAPDNSNGVDRECSPCDGGYAAVAHGCSQTTVTTTRTTWTSTARTSTTRFETTADSAATTATTSMLVDDCPEGSITDEGELQGVCDVCRKGTVPNAAQTECVFCAAGTFAAKPGQASCNSCPTGTVTASNGAGCEECLAGFVIDQVTRHCSKCPAGSAAVAVRTSSTSSTKTASCEECRGNDVVSLDGTACKPCPGGTTANQDNTECKGILATTPAPGVGAPPQMPCAQGCVGEYPEGSSNYLCPDESVAGPICNPPACQWEVRACTEAWAAPNNQMKHMFSEADIAAAHVRSNSAPAAAAAAADEDGGGGGGGGNSGSTTEIAAIAAGATFLIALMVVITVVRVRRNTAGTANLAASRAGVIVAHGYNNPTYAP